MSNRSFHLANRFQTMISAIRAAPLRVLFLAVAVAVVGLMTVTDLTPAAPVHAQEQAVTATRDATGESPPARPTDLQAAAGPDSVSLTWTASTDQTVTHYAILLRDRDEDDAGVFEVIDSNAGSATSYTDGSVSPGGSYVYRVKAVSPTGVSQWSSYARADIPADPEDLAPSGLSAKAVFDGGDSAGVELAWDAPAVDAASVTAYEILRAVGDGDLATLVADTGSADTTYTDDTATEAGERYAYRVKALRGEETSQPSDRAEAIIPKVTTVDPEPGIAEEQNVGVWSATLTVRSISSSILGCSNDVQGDSCTSYLTETSFRYDETDYAVRVVILRSNGRLEFEVDTVPTEDTRTDLVLNVGGSPFPFSSSITTSKSLKWNNSGLSWTADTDVALTLTAVPAAAPAVSSVDVTSDPGGDDTYAIGDTIQVTVTFDQVVTVDTSDGTPRIQLRVGGGEDEHLKWADYLTGTGAAVLQFTYVVQTGDFDDNGFDIAADELELNGGTIQSSGGTDANLDYPDQDTQSGHKVDGVRPTPELAATSVDGNSVFIIFSETLSATTASANAFTLSLDTGTAPAVSTATASGDTVTLGLASALTISQAVTVTYVDATSGDDAAAVQDAAGNDAANFTTGEGGVPAVANAVGTGCSLVDGCYVVPADWGLIPTGLGAGAEFRLIFRTSGTRNAASTDIADYNTFVQTAASSGHADIQQYSSTIRVLGSTAAVDARDNTVTTYTADDKGVAIYWLGGAKVADDYEDFYDGSWSNGDAGKDEHGADRAPEAIFLQAVGTFTGSVPNGTEAATGLGASRGLGASSVRLGEPFSGSTSVSNANLGPFYGLSGVFRVADQVVTNTAPAFTTDAEFSTNENQTASFQVTAMDADDGDEVSYAITGGADQSFFVINANSGLLFFPTPYDHENPLDADGNNTYLVTVTATGGTGARALTTDQAITVTLNDVDEPPSAPATPTVSAVTGSSDSLSVTWTAPDNAGKPDIASYDLQYRKGTTGNFADGPQDVTGLTDTITGLDADSLYQVQVRATNDEGDGAWSSPGSGTTNAQAGCGTLPADRLWSACLTVGEINAAGTYGYQASFSTGSLAPATFDVGTTTYTVNELFDNDIGSTYVQITLAPAISEDDAGNLTLHLGDDTSLSFADATYSTPTGRSWHVWSRTAALGWTTDDAIVVGITQEAQANTAPAFTSGANFSTNENQAATFQVTAEDADAGDEVTYAITGGADQAKFDIDASSGVLTFKVAPDHENPTDADGNNVYLVTVTATGGTGARALTADQAITVTVTAVDEIWSATMTVGVNSTLLGWDDAGNYIGSALSDEDFDYGGDTYNLSVIRLASGNLIVIFNGAGDLATKATRDKLTLHVGATTFNFGAGALNAAETGVAWSAGGLIWSDGDTVELKITVSEDAEVALTSDPGADDTYAIGDAIEATATFGQAVTVTGTPQIEMQVGGETRTADYASGSGSTNLVFSYTVVEGDLDADGVAVELGLIDLNGGTILVGTTAAGLIHGAVSASTDHKVDGVRPIFVSAETNEAGTRLFVTFSEPISAFYITSVALSTGASLTVIEIDGAVVELDTTPDSAHGRTLAIHLAFDAVRDLAGNPNSSSNNNPITNNVLAVCGTLPTDRLWSACLTAGAISTSGRTGYASGSSMGTLVPATFDVGTTTHTVTHLFDNDDFGGSTYVQISLAPVISEDDAGSLTLHLGDDTSLSFGDATFDRDGLFQTHLVPHHRPGLVGGRRHRGGHHPGGAGQRRPKLPLGELDAGGGGEQRRRRRRRRPRHRHRYRHRRHPDLHPGGDRRLLLRHRLHQRPDSDEGRRDLRPRVAGGILRHGQGRRRQRRDRHHRRDHRHRRRGRAPLGPGGPHGLRRLRHDRQPGGDLDGPRQQRQAGHRVLRPAIPQGDQRDLD